MVTSRARRLAAALAGAAFGLTLGACATTAPPRAGAPAAGAPLDAGRPATTRPGEPPVTTAAQARARAAQAHAKGDADLTLYYLVRTAELDPEDTDALLLIGARHEARGSLGEARRAYELALERDPGRRELRERAGLLYVQLALDRDARALLEPLAVSGGADWRVHNALGILADRDGRHDAAQVEYTAALECAPQSGTTFNNRGYSRLLNGDLVGAERDFRAALALGTSARAWTNLGAVQGRRGSYADELASLLHVLPEHEALNRVGESALARQDYAIARDFLLRATEASPTWFERAHASLEVAEAHLALPPVRR